MANLSNELSLWIGLLEEKLIYKWQSITFANIHVLSEANLTCENSGRLQIGNDSFFF